MKNDGDGRFRGGSGIASHDSMYYSGVYGESTIGLGSMGHQDRASMSGGQWRRAEPELRFSGTI